MEETCAQGLVAAGLVESAALEGLKTLKAKVAGAGHLLALPELGVSFSISVWQSGRRATLVVLLGRRLLNAAREAGLIKEPPPRQRGGGRCT